MIPTPLWQEPSPVGDGLYTQFTIPFPLFAELGLACETGGGGGGGGKSDARPRLHQASTLATLMYVTPPFLIHNIYTQLYKTGEE